MKRAILVTVLLVAGVFVACGSVSGKSDSGVDTSGSGGPCKFDNGNFDSCVFAP